MRAKRSHVPLVDGREKIEGANFKPGSAEEKAKIYYESCLDRNDTVELRGTKPMQDLIESVSVFVLLVECSIHNTLSFRLTPIFIANYNKLWAQFKLGVTYDVLI